MGGLHTIERLFLAATLNAVGLTACMASAQDKTGIDLTTLADSVPESQKSDGLPEAVQLFSNTYLTVLQPKNEPNWVSSEPGQLTFFSQAESCGKHGLLAHVNPDIQQLTVGTYLLLVTDGKQELYQVSKVVMYEVIEPSNPNSDFRTLDGLDKILTAKEASMSIYCSDDGSIVFQSCIDFKGNPKGARVFSFAEKVE